MRNIGNDIDADCEYWGLTREQSARYCARLSRMWADIAAKHANMAVELSKDTFRWVDVLIAVGLVALTLGVFALAMRGMAP